MGLSDETDGGFAGNHPTQQIQPFLVAPTATTPFNTFRPALFPVACWSIGDVRFEFDSSFVKAELANEIPLLSKLIKRHSRQGSRPPASIFGHADPTGNDDYNKQISGRRAAAIYGLLVRDVGIWEDLFAHPFGGDNWQRNSVDSILDVISGKSGPDAVRDFQSSQGLVVDGIAGPVTRASLFLAYMDAICLDETGQPFQLQKGDFLAAGADPGGKGDFQGCSEFNPFLRLSRNNSSTLTKLERDQSNAPNRRVITFLFPPGLRINTQQWPCPRVNEDVSGCKERFFSDAERRRAAGDDQREYQQTRDTFACRFYDRLARRSPCEGLRNQEIVEILFDDPFFGPVKDLAVEVTFPFVSGADALMTDADGAVFIEVSRGPFADTKYEKEGYVQERRVFLAPPDVTTQNGAWQRLVNMGYVPGQQPGETPATNDELTRATLEFQLEYRIPMTGMLDSFTCDQIEAAHEDPTPWQHRKWMDDPRPGPNLPTPKGDNT